MAERRHGRRDDALGEALVVDIGDRDRVVVLADNDGVVRLVEMQGEDAPKDRAGAGQGRSLAGLERLDFREPVENFCFEASR